MATKKKAQSGADVGSTKVKQDTTSTTKVRDIPVIGALVSSPKKKLGGKIKPKMKCGGKTKKKK